MNEQLYLNKEQIKLVKNFIVSNACFYSAYEKEMLLKSVYSPYKIKNLPNLLLQIYDYLNIIPAKNNIYNFFVDFISEISGLDKNIVEIGGGVIPCLSKKIALRQKKGHITVYDPRIMQKNFAIPNLTLKKEKFTQNTPVDNIDLLIGFMPCEATQTIIDKACNANIDFIIALCDDIGYNDTSYFESSDEWQHYIKYITSRKLEQTTLGKLNYQYVKRGLEFPIIYNNKVR